MTGADDVVQAFRLPKQKHYTPATASEHIAVETTSRTPSLSGDEQTTDYMQQVDEGAADDIEMDELAALPTSLAPKTNGGPMSMRELVVASAMQKSDESEQSVDKNEMIVDPTPSGSRMNSSSPSKDNGLGNSKQRAGTKRLRKAQTASSDSLDSEQPSRSYRERRRKVAPNVSEVPGPSRTLRPRTAKSAAKIQKEKETEEAYQSAIAR